MVCFIRYTEATEVKFYWQAMIASYFKKYVGLVLVECKTRSYSKNKGIEHYDQTGQAKPGKYFK